MKKFLKLSGMALAAAMAVVIGVYALTDAVVEFTSKSKVSFTAQPGVQTTVLGTITSHPGEGEVSNQVLFDTTDPDSIITEQDFEDTVFVKDASTGEWHVEYEFTVTNAEEDKESTTLDAYIIVYIPDDKNIVLGAVTSGDFTDKTDEMDEEREIAGYTATMYKVTVADAAATLKFRIVVENVYEGITDAEVQFAISVDYTPEVDI